MKLASSAVIAGFILLHAGCAAHSAAPSMQHMNMQMPAATTGAHVHGDDAIAHFSVKSANYLPGEQANVIILIQNRWNRPIDKFTIQHEKLMHLIVVSKDLTYFDHIHPEYKGGGRFEVTTSFPAAGDYKLIADFVPEGMGQAVQTHWVHIGGKPAKSVPPEPDKSLTKMVDGKEVTLAFDHAMAGMDLRMRFAIRDAATKQPVTDLQPYLGSLGHAVAISGDASQYVHVHPDDPKGSGPDADFTISFPKSGIYKIWGQFQQHDKVFTVPFTVNVP